MELNALFTNDAIFSAFFNVLLASLYRARSRSDTPELFSDTTALTNSPMENDNVVVPNSALIVVVCCWSIFVEEGSFYCLLQV